MSELDDRTRDALQTAVSRTAVSHPPTERIVTAGRRLRRRRRQGAGLAAGAIVAVAVVASAAVYRGLPARHDTLRPASPAPATAASHTARADAVAFGLSPDVDLDRDTVNCGLTTEVPLRELTLPGGDEAAATPEAVGLRAFLAHNPFAAGAPAPPGRWVLLAEDAGQVAFGRRDGPIGVSDAYLLQRQPDGTWTPAGTNGCGLRRLADGTTTAATSAASSTGTTLTLEWANGACHAPVPDEINAGVQVHETPTQVFIAVLTRPNPALAPVDVCGGVGLTSRLDVTLKTPLGARTLIDAAKVPGAPVRLTARNTNLDSPPPCKAMNLRVAAGTGSGAAGSVVYDIGLTNEGGENCLLRGVPRSVTGVLPDGRHVILPVRAEMPGAGPVPPFPALPIPPGEQADLPLIGDHTCEHPTFQHFTRLDITLADGQHITVTTPPTAPAASAAGAAGTAATTPADSGWSFPCGDVATAGPYGPLPHGP